MTAPAALSRRRLLASGAAVIAGLAAPALWTRPALADTFSQPPLPYPETALEPAISARTVGLHYGAHHAGYFRNLNRLTADTPLASLTLEEVVVRSSGVPSLQAVFNNAGQAWNHVVYWEQFRPGGPAAPEGRLAAAIDDAFGGFEPFKAALVGTAAGVFGSGWAWLEWHAGSLHLTGTRNADNPLARGRTALLGIDVWEHAYYLDYENRRGEHVSAVLESLVNWSVVADRMPA